MSPPVSAEPAVLAGLECPRCTARVDPRDPGTHLGCPRCRARGEPVNLVCRTDPDRLAAALAAPVDRRAGIWAWADALPVPARWGSPLGEGHTPLLPAPRLGAALGVPGLLVKNETVNPTWSHKDRLAAAAVAAARALGADTVTASSSGNHGAAVAAHAARAGLGCVLFTVAGVPAPVAAQLRGYGAEVVELTDPDERYARMAAGIARGWYPASNAALPPVGSSPYGVDGYKTIAYELAAELGRAPDAVVLPVCYGDLAAGVHRGFADLVAAGRTAAVPRIVGAEVTGALGRGIAGAPPRRPAHRSAAFSIDTALTADQAVRAVRDSGGRAVTVSERALGAARGLLARTEGLLAEAASCAAVAAAGTAAAGLPPDATVVVVLTASGLKDAG